jgi:hypothetical protein
VNSELENTGGVGSRGLLPRELTIEAKDDEDNQTKVLPSNSISSSYSLI